MSLVCFFAFSLFNTIIQSPRSHTINHHPSTNSEKGGKEGDQSDDRRFVVLEVEEFKGTRVALPIVSKCVKMVMMRSESVVEIKRVDRILVLA